MTKLKRITIPALVLNAMLVFCMVAQDYNVPLTVEGLNNVTNNSVMSKAMGGVTIPLQKDVSLMFVNPTSLGTLEGLTISVGASQTYTSADQTQQWQPNTYFGNFSLLMDGSSKGVTHVKTSTPGIYPGDTLYYPYDNIDGAHWSHDKNPNDFIPDIFIGMPFNLEKVKLSAGIGYSEYANLDYYYQNNNVLAPEYDLLQTPVSVDTAVRVDWSQAIHRREGILHGIGGAVSAAFFEKLSVGVSARYITGSTDDFDQTVGRGVLYFMSVKYVSDKWGLSNNCMRLDSVHYAWSNIGTSDYIGYEAAVNATYRGKDVAFGATVLIPSTITRKYSGKVTANYDATKDFSKSNWSTDTSSSMDLNLPVRGRFGIGIQVRENVYVAMEYEYLPYSSAELKDNNTGKTTNPWLDGYNFHFGISWNPIEKASLYFGYHKACEVFQAQYSAFDNQPVSYIAYSAGIGVQLIKGLELNAAYEFYEQKYEDTWVDNSNINILTSSTISIGLQYTLQ